MYDCIIIGKGPAGISASLYAARSGLSTAVVGGGTGALDKASIIENYYGLDMPVSGNTLQQRGEAQARRFGVELIETEVLEVLQENTFLVNTISGSLETRSLILAVGKPRKSCNIPGIKQLEGKGISYCAVCDAFFYRGKSVAVIGNGEYAANEAKHLKRVVQSVTVFTDGESPVSAVSQSYAVEERKISSVVGESRVSAIEMEDGSLLQTDGIFLAIGQASALDFARKLGIAVKENRILVDSNQMTNIPGVFAAGDCTGKFLQIATAVGDGALAGQQAVEFVKKMKI